MTTNTKPAETNRLASRSMGLQPLCDTMPSLRGCEGWSGGGLDEGKAIIRITKSVMAGGWPVGSVHEMPAGEAASYIKMGIAELVHVESKSRQAPQGFGDDASPTLTEGRSLKDFLDCVLRDDAERLAKVYKSQLTGQSGTAGGYTVPSDLAEDILVDAGPSAILDRITVLPMTSAELEVPYFDCTSSPALSGKSARFGNAKHYWTEESQQPTATGEPTLKQIKLTARELVCLFDLSNALNDDMGEARKITLARGIGESALWEWERTFLVGSGVGEPLGMLTSGAAISVSRQNANDITMTDLGKMFCRMAPEWSAETAVWAAHPSTLEKLIPLAATTGIPSQARTNSPFFLLGIPLHFSEALEPLGTAKDLALLDCSKYVAGVRTPHLLRASGHAKFLQRLTTWRFSSRIDGMPWLRGAITPANGSATLSPFVYLS
jgi:HK97 family phage major capsid protein